MTKKKKEVVCNEAKTIDLDSLTHEELKALAADVSYKVQQKDKEFKESEFVKELREKGKELAKRHKALCKDTSTACNIPLKLTLHIDPMDFHESLIKGYVDIPSLFDFEVVGTLGKTSGLNSEGKKLLQTFLEEQLRDACSDALMLFPGQHEALAAFADDVADLVEAIEVHDLKFSDIK